MNHAKDNFKNNYLIFKSNYIPCLVTFFFFPINFIDNSLPPFY
jgi:hypothetical protein